MALAILVAFGVPLETFVVRSLLVPAAALDTGPRFWWPSRLAASARGAAAPVRLADPPPTLVRCP